MLARKYQSQHENRQQSSSSLSHLEPLDDGGSYINESCSKETSLSQIEESYQSSSTSPHPKSLLEDEDSPLRTDIKTRILLLLLL